MKLIEADKEKTLRRDYWKRKFSNSIALESSEEQDLDVFNVEIKSEDVSAFNSITLNAELAEYTVLVSLYAFLIESYFSDSFDGLVYSEFNAKPLSNPFLLKISKNINDKTLKNWLKEVAKEIETVSAYTKIYDEELKSYSNFGFTYTRSEINNTASKKLYLEVLKNHDQSLSASFIYDKKYFPTYLIKSFVEGFKQILINIKDVLDLELINISLLNKVEENKILNEFNANHVKYEEEKNIVDLIEEQVLKTPNDVALIVEKTIFTYQQLNEKSNSLAYFLREKYSVNSNDLIAVKLNRDEQLIIALLAVLKSGAAYVPVDLDYPEQRIQYIENDSNCKVVVDEEFLKDFYIQQGEYASENLSKINGANDLAYIIYTSGSTGKPKGTMVMHRNAYELVQWAKQEFGTSTFETTYAATSHCFDLSVYEIFYTLAIGKKIRLLKNALEIEKYLPGDANVLINTVPSVARKLLESGAYSPDHVSVLNLAGETFPADIVPHLFVDKIEVRNLYGPSEDTTYSTCYKLSNRTYTDIPIGKPITNTQAYVLNDALQPVPVGVSGKLFIAGAGVTKGYLNLRELTNERFVKNPFVDGERMYDTGDLAKWEPNGNLTFLGRKDAQVKLHGYRIELGEIEHAILTFSEGLTQAVVDIKQHRSESVLVAYYVENAAIDKSDLRAFLTAKMPAYMIPGYFIKIADIPLTANGKVDRKALPEIEDVAIVKKEYIAPSNDVEKALVNIWEEVLGIAPIGVNDHFFELGGHSLMISQIINAIYKDLEQSVPYKIFFANPTIGDLGKALKKQTYQPIPKASPAASYPLTPSQERLWLLSQFDGGNEAYQISGAVELVGELDEANFTAAFQHVVSRHEILRTVFKKNKEGIIQQYILPINEFRFSVETKDFSEEISSVNAIQKYIKQKNKQSYDLTKAPLFSAALLKRKEESFVFYLSVHHLVSDGWSLEVLTSEVLKLYESFQKGETISNLQETVQFKDYAIWLEKEQKKEAFQLAKSYWTKQFEENIPTIYLPGTQARPVVKTYNGSQYRQTFTKDLSSKLQQLSNEHRVTLFMTLMSAVKALLSRYSSQDDIIVGTPVAGREHPDLENQVGLYINTLATRTFIDQKEKFSDLLQKEAQQLLAAYEHQAYPFDQLIEQLKLKRDTSRSPLFDIMVVFQNQQQLTSFERGEIASLSVHEFETKPETTQFDIVFTFSQKESLHLDLIYNTDIYTEDFIAGIGRHLESIFTQIVKTPEVLLEEIDLVSDREKELLLETFNDTNANFDLSKTVVDLFEEQVEKMPQQIAVSVDDEKLSFELLNELSNKLANYLIDNYQIGKGDLVGLKLERSEHLIISVLGILKTGAAYVPIDTNYPEKRIKYIQDDIAAKVIIDKTFINDFYNQKNTSSIKPAINIENTDLAYVIYTSGSTGKPKGVMISHKSLTNLCFWHIDAYRLDENSRGTLFSGIAFDASVWEIYPYLISGARLYPVKEEIRLQTPLLVSFFKTNGITHAYLPSKVCQDLITKTKEPLSTIILTGGESFNYSPGTAIQVYNNYGPTENAVVTTSYNCIEATESKVPIGKPIANSRIYILSKNLKLQAVGVVGELCVSGTGLSMGYLNRPELTAKSFIPNPFEKGELMYKTGDLARWLPDGNIEFIGRKDRQIKIRGHRIELGEIDYAIKELGIKEVVSEVKELNGEKVLVAYIVGAQGIEKESIRESLKDHLSDYMIPNYFIELESIPLTQNGKTDRKALPEIDEKDLIKKEYVAPQSDEEQAMAAVWTKVLGIEKIGVSDNFFDLGGHSLLVSQVLNGIQKELGKQVSFQDFFSNPTIAGLLSVKHQEKTYQAIPKSPSAVSYPMTDAQKRLWVLSQLEGGSLAYNMPMAIRLKGTINEALFETAFKALIERHEILRTAFRANTEGEVRQYILPIDKVEFELEQVDFRKKKNKDGAIKEYVSGKNKEAFDLAKAVLLKATLIKTRKEESIFYVVMHHIVGDGWSMEILISELVKIYNALSEGQTIDLPDLNIQYKDYAVWQNEETQIARQQASEEYWLEQFSGELPVLELPTYKTRPIIQTYNGTSISHSYPEHFLNKLKSYSKTADATLFMTLLAGVNALLYRYTNQKDIIIGTPIAGRNHPELENQIGLYLNTLAIRTKIEKGQSFEGLLAYEKANLLKAYEYQNYPFDALVGQLNLKRDTSRSALFDVMVVLQNQGQLNNVNGGSKLSGLEVSDYGLKQETSQFDIRFTFIEKEGLDLLIEYNTDIYDESLISRIFSHFENLMQGLMNNPESDLETIDFLTEVERENILIKNNDTLVVYPEEKTIVDLIEEQVQKSPEAIAVHVEDRALTYEIINNRSNQLAHFLLENHVIKAEELIGVKLERDEWLLISLLAILKTGGAYVPIDPSYPKQRITYIEKDSNCKFTIDEKLITAFKSRAKDYSTENPDLNIVPSQLAYVIYTSGSTGQPKGVMLEHGNAVSMLSWAKDEYVSTGFELMYAVTSHCFDLSVYELFYPLSIGKSLRILKNGLELGCYLGKEDKLLINTVPSLIQSLIEDGISFEGAVAINMAGEPVPLSLSNSLAVGEIEVRNLYGPSEDTTYSSCYRINQSFDRSIPIGKPISNTKFYILSEALQIQAEGVVGELCISGSGLSRGYLNRSSLTTEKFISNPFEEDTLMYKTGDLARWLPDGNIEFIGRKDRQVKIRGHRIELGEIDHMLMEMGIKQAVSEVKESQGEKTVVAYVVVDGTLEKESLRRKLGERLPAYMIPSFFVEMAPIPLTPNGKVDRKALPEIEQHDLIKKAYQAPKTKIEKALVSIWEDVLGIEQVGTLDNFFELGGHSLIISQVLNRTQKELGKVISFQDFFSNPTIEGLVKKLKTESYISIPKAPVSSSYPLTASQNRLWVLSQLEGGSQAYNMPMAIQLKGTLDEDLFEESFRRLIDRHEILRTSFATNAEGEIQQYIHAIDQIDFDFEKIDYRKKGIVINEHINARSKAPFDLSKAPLLRGGLIKIEEATTIFYAAMHHIIGDGWSIEVLMFELVEIYNALSNETSVELPDLNIQYKDYAVWLNTKLGSEKENASEKYWLEQFSGELPVLELPTYKTRPIIQTYNGTSISHSYSEQFLNKLKSYCKTADATLFMTLLAGVNALLYRYTNQKDIIIGTPIAGRNHPELENQIGLYLNTLAIRTKIEKGQGFEDLLAYEKANLLKAYEYQNYPFDALVGQLNLKRDTSRSALFDVMVVLQNQGQLNNVNAGSKLSGLEVSDYDLKQETSQFDIRFTFIEKEGLDLSIEYNTDIYDESLISRIFSHFGNLMQGFLLNPESNLEEIDFLTKSERENILIKNNDTLVAYPEDKTIVDLIEEQVQKSPEAIAVHVEDRTLTYETINNRSNQLAHYLLENHEVKTEELIGVKLERDEWLLISLLAILKTGGAYVPIDPSYPKQRIAYIEKDSNCKFTIDEELIASFKKTAGGYSTGNPELNISPSQLAYVIYTSGSTGQPKGVILKHNNAVELINWSEGEFRNTDFDILYAVTSYCFDLSIFEFFYPLSIGKEIRILENGLAIDDYISVDKKVLLNTVPSVIGGLHERSTSFENVVGINMAGEPIPIALSNQLLEHKIELRNLYGPSEDTTYSSCYRINKKHEQALSIGKPISNTRFYILSESLSLQPEGVIGELCISGTGLSKGYLNRTELSEEKFIANPYEEESLMYKTGDLAYWLPDGNVAFIGRKDDQVKVRGYRIELGEIENALTMQEGIRDAVVLIKKEAGDKAIFAYVMGDALNSATIRLELSKDLPNYMMPNHYVEVEKIPVTPNGKIDKKALLELKTSNNIEADYVAPETELEKQIVNIWQEVLGQKTISMTDDFFERGGHSLLLTKLLGKYQKAFKKTIELKVLYNSTSLKSHVSMLLMSSQELEEIGNAAQQEYYVLSPSQLRFWLIFKIRGKSREFNIYNTITLPEELDANVFEAAFNELVKRHEILRTEFVEVAGTPKQRVLAHQPIEIPYYKTIGEAKNEVIEYEFDLETYPLFKVAIVQDSTSHQLLFNIHHSISDGWSIDIISRDIMEIYNAKIANRKIDLPELTIHYKDYAEWQNKLHQSLEANKDEDYWKQQLSGKLPYLQLPSDYTIKLKSLEAASSYTIYVSTILKQKIETLASKNGLSMFTVFVAALKILLYRLTSEKDIIIGIPSANRNNYQLKDLIGCFLNTLMLRDTIDENESFQLYLKQVSQTLQDALTHQNYPFEKLLNLLEIPQKDDRFPISPVFLNMLDFEGNTAETIDDFSPEHSVMETLPKFDLECYIKSFTNGFSLNWVYDHKLFKKETIQYWVDAYLSILNQVTENVEQEVSAIKVFESYFYQEEEERPTNEFEYFEGEEIEQSISQRFEKQVLRFPNHKAVHANGVELSYEALNNEANYLAHQISENEDTGTERIALLLKHNEKCVIGMLGTLKAGYAYVPIDYNNPLKRIQYILEDSNSNVIVCSEETLNIVKQLQKQLPGLRAIVLSSAKETGIVFPNPERDINPLQEAYVLYTSGSTGKPKGVVQNQRNVLHYIRVYTNNVHITNEDNLSVFSTYTFDASVKDIYGAILNGGKVSIYNVVENGLHNLSNWLLEQKITIIHMVPTIYRHFIKTLQEGEILNNIRLLDLGGEACYKSDLELFKKHFPKKAFLVNDYGPTEATIVLQKFLNHSSEISRNNLPLGNSVTETTVFLMDENNQRKGIYEEGEIVFESNYLSLGYLNRKELTEKAFITNLSKNKRIYKSGDIGKMLPNGEIEFLHRKDSQIKINGLRIELSEIEYQLEQLENVEEAIVVLKTLNENKYLTAYIRSATELEINELKVSLEDRLPKYMIPAIYMFMDEFPRTRTGKIDRKAFPNPIISDLQTTVYTAPESRVEHELVRIWEDLLLVSKIGVNDNFFDLGGHSLSAVQMTQKVHKLLNVKIEITDVFANLTIRALSEFIEKQKEDLYETIPVLAKQNYYDLSNAQLRIWVACKFEGGSLAYNVSNAFVLQGDIDESLLEKAFSAVISKNESLRTSFIEVETKPKQKIIPVEEVQFKLQTIDLKTTDKEAIGIKEIIEEENKKIFKLEKGPLLRATLIKAKDQENIIVVNIHHIVIDGWSVNLFFKQLLESYKKQMLYIEEDLTPAPIQYKEYASWHSDVFESKRKFWDDLYAMNVPESNFPTDFPRTKILSFESSTIKKVVNKELFQKLNGQAKALGLTLNNLIFALYSLLIAKYSDQKEVVIGSLVSGRNHLETENILGVFINFLPIKLTAKERFSLREYVENSNEVLLNAYKNQDYPFDLMVEHYLKRRDLSRNPFFDTMINFHSESDVNIMTGGMDMEEFGLSIGGDGSGLNDQTTSGLDIKLEITPSSKEALTIGLSYNKKLFKAETIELLFNSLLQLFKEFINTPEMKIKDCLKDVSQQNSETQKMKALPVNICGSFVLEPMKDILNYWSGEYEMKLDLNFAPYNQVFQQLLEPSSILHDSGINVLFIRADDFLRDFKKTSESEKIVFLQNTFKELIKSFQQSRNFAFVPYVICIVPPDEDLYSDAGRLLKAIISLNEKLAAFFEKTTGCYLLDLEEAMSIYDVEEVYDSKADEIGHMPFSSDGYVALATFLARKIRAWKDAPYKVIAVDCDNTIWGGVCGEDGTDGVIIDEHFQAVQQFLVNKQREGFLLVLCSKNNEGDVWEVFNTRDEMVLKPTDVIDHRINWTVKADNVRDLAKELNVGVNSFIFLDDSDFEIEQMMSKCPEVLSLQMPDSPTDFDGFLKNNWAFDKLHITEEDAKRSNMYKAEKNRKVEKKQAGEHTKDFIASLNIKVHLDDLVEKDIERTVQLTQRTNQFNLNGIRKTASDVIESWRKGNTLNWTIRVEDKFGEYGLVGVLIGERSNGVLRINTFLLSCRVLGRNVEHKIMEAIENYRVENDIESVVLEFIQTPKNKPFEQFIKTVLEDTTYQVPANRTCLNSFCNP